MKLHGYQRSRSLRPWFKVTQISKLKLALFFLTAGQIEAKFHMKPLWHGETKVCSNGGLRRHITIVTAMTIYGKTP